MSLLFKAPISVPYRSSVKPMVSGVLGPSVSIVKFKKLEKHRCSLLRRFLRLYILEGLHKGGLESPRRARNFVHQVMNIL